MISIYSFCMFVGASMGPLLVAALEPFGFGVLCIVLAAVLALVGIFLKAPAAPAAEA